MKPNFLFFAVVFTVTLCQEVVVKNAAEGNVA